MTNINLSLSVDKASILQALYEQCKNHAVFIGRLIGTANSHRLCTANQNSFNACHSCSIGQMLKYILASTATDTIILRTSLWLDPMCFHNRTFQPRMTMLPTRVITIQVLYTHSIHPHLNKCLFPHKWQETDQLHAFKITISHFSICYTTSLHDCNFSEGPIRAACLVYQLYDSMMPPAVYTSDAHTKMEWLDHNGA